MKLEELARLAGVSKSTASIILNGHAERYRISQRTCEKVMGLARKYNYIANAQAAGLRSQNSKLLALILPDLVHHGFAKLSKHLEQLSRKAGYQLLISSSDDSPETEIEVVKTLTGRKVEAIIAVSTLINYEIYEQAEERGIPVILLDRHQPQTHLDFIVSDDKKAAYGLTKLLLNSNPDSITYFGGTETIENSRLRLAGFNKALNEVQKGKIKTEVFHRDFSVESGFQMMSDYFDLHQTLPDTLFTSSFTLMEGALQFSRQYLRQMPDQLNWGTFGNSYILDLLPFTIHSAQQCYEQMASQVLMMLESKAKKEAYQQQVVLERELIRR